MQPTETNASGRSLRLGRLLRSQRDKLGLSAAEVEGRGGPGANVIYNVENAYRPVSHRSLALLEDVLGLERGTCAAVLAGEQDLLAVRDTANEQAERLASMSTSELHDLMTAATAELVRRAGK